MISLYLAILRLLKAAIRSARDEEFRALALVTTVLLASGTWFYSHAEQWNLLDSFYICVMTMTPIGYGDFVPTTTLAKIFTIIYAFISIGVFVSLAAKLATRLMRDDKQGWHKLHKEHQD